MDFVFWVFFALYIPGCFLEKLATQKQKWAPEKKKIPKKSLLPLSKRSIPARQKNFRKYHSTLAKYLRKNCVSPPSCSHQQSQSVYLDVHPCQGGRQGMRHHTVPPKWCQRILGVRESALGSRFSC